MGNADSLILTEQPNRLVEDANGRIRVLCDGGYEEEKAALYRIDPQNVQVEKAFTFTDIGESPTGLVISPDRSTLFFLQKGVRKMGVQANSLPTNVLIDEGEGRFYNLEVAGDQGRIFVTDAKDHVQKGSLYRFGSDGTPIDTFETGIIPNDLHFRIQ